MLPFFILGGRRQVYLDVLRSQAKAFLWFSDLFLSRADALKISKNNYLVIWLFCRLVV
jgi:hypothetical protein